MKQFVPNFSEFSRVYEQVAKEDEILKGGKADDQEFRFVRSADVLEKQQVKPFSVTLYK